MFEKEAEEIVKRNVCGDCNKCQSHGYIGCEVYRYSRDSYLRGANDGYNKAFVEADKNLKAVVADFNKANEWHYVKDGKDLPLEAGLHIRVVLHNGNEYICETDYYEPSEDEIGFGHLLIQLYSNEETVKMMAESGKSNKGRIMSEEQRRRISEAQKARKHQPLSEESKRKISESNKGHKSWNKGKHLSEEHKRKVSDSLKGHIVTKETREKMSNFWTGKHWKNVNGTRVYLPELKESE